MTANDMKTAVIKYNSMGFVVHPLSSPNDKGNSPGKRPLIKGWQALKETPSNINTYIDNGCNLGLVCGKVSNVTNLDFDNFLFLDQVFNGAGELETLRCKRTEGRGHTYFKYNPNLPASKHHDLGIEVLSDGNNAVIPPSIHKSGEVYKSNGKPIIEMPEKVLDNLNRLFKTETELKQIIGKCRKCFKTILGNDKDVHGSDGREYMLAICTDLKSNGAKEDHIKMFARIIYGKDYDEKRTLTEWNNIDASKTWKCETLRAKLPAYIDSDECNKCDKRRDNKKGNANVPTKDDVKTVLDNGFGVYRDNMELVEEFQKVAPTIYDISKNYYVYLEKMGYYKRIDDTDILSAIRRKSQEYVIDGKTSGEIKRAIQITGRERLETMKPVKETWIHTLNGIVDFKTGEQIQPSPEYFLTCPIPHKVGSADNTPTIDKIFNDWIGDRRQILYEILAYCLVDSYPINRMFILFGSGRNGKSQFLELLTRFIGYENTTSTELEKIIDSRFECSKLHRKKAALIGETNFTAIKSSDRIKKITGHDMLTAEFKGKDPFDFTNTAKILIASNSIPETLDKTEAFHSRCIIIEFTNRFNEGKPIIDTIPEQEYENLLYKCLKLLPELMEKGKFTNEGTIEEKAAKYEKLSNPWLTYEKEKLDYSDINANTPLWILYEEYLSFCSHNHFRVESKNEIARKLRNAGINVEKRSISGSSQYYVLGVKMTQMTQMTQLQVSTPMREPVKNSVICVIPVIPHLKEMEQIRINQLKTPIIEQTSVNSTQEAK
jgi:P4 family phage/plasmid primase-like protien